MLESLTEYNYTKHVKLDDSINIQAVFFAHEESIWRFPNVLLLDCTLNTNVFQMPLLHFVGITNTFSSFYAGFAFYKE